MMTLQEAIDKVYWQDFYSSSATDEESEAVRLVLDAARREADRTEAP